MNKIAWYEVFGDHPNGFSGIVNLRIDRWEQIGEDGSSHNVELLIIERT